MKHNETCNVWTHLIPFIYFVITIIIVAFDNNYESNLIKNSDDEEDSDIDKDDFFVSKWPLILFLLCCCFCMGSSVLYHLFNDMDPHSNCLLHLDYSGIIILMLGSCTCGYYYAFYC